MGSILLVVGDAASPTAGDATVKSLIESLGHTVSYRSDEAAESPTAGYAGIVVSESVSGGVIGSKYATVNIPLVTHEGAHLDVLGFNTTTQSTVAGQTNVVWIAGSPIADGPYGTLSGTDTIFSAGSALGWSESTTMAAGVTKLATHDGVSNRIACMAANAGATLTFGAAPAKRAFIWPSSTTAAANINSLGQDAVKNAYYWAFGVASSVGYSNEVLADSPKAYFRMQEASGNIQDSSGLAHHATSVTGSATYTYRVGSPISGGTDYAIAWTGGGGGFSVPDHADLDLGDVMTAEAWVYRSDLGVTRVISGKGVNALSWGVDGATGNLFAAKANVGIIVYSTTAVPLSTWTHVAYTKNGATNKVYINGVDRTGTVTNQTLSSTATAQSIGVDYDGTSYAWYGALDEVAFYATALSQARIQAHYNAAFAAPSGSGSSAPRMLTLGVA